jgi:cation transport ATPase
MTLSRQAVSKVLFVLSIPLMLLALLCFAVPIIGSLNGLSYEGLDLGVWGIFYFLLALPAAALIATSIWLRGWKEAKSGKIALSVLFGIPAITVAVVFGVVVMHRPS